MKNIVIMNISEKDNPETFTIQSNVYIKVNIEQFIYFISRDDINKSLPEVLFIIDDIPWCNIVFALKESKHEVSVSGGSNNKRHLISKLNTRLICYMLAIFNFDYNRLNFLNGFDTIDKTEILPFIDYSNKKGFRFTPSNSKTITTIEEVVDLTTKNNYESDDRTELINDIMGINITSENNEKEPKNIESNDREEIKDNVNSIADKKHYINPFNTHIQKRNFHSSIRCLNVKKSSIITYLDDIEHMLKSNNDDMFKIQYKIESSWISLMKEKLEQDPQSLTWGIIPTLIRKAVTVFENHADQGITKRRFKSYHTELLEYKYEVILLTISMLLTYHSRLNATNLTIQLGEKISELLFILILKNENDNDKDYGGEIKYNLKKRLYDWRRSNKLYNKLDLLKLGDYFVNIFTNEPSAIFDIAVKDDDNYTSQKILKISDEYIDQIKDDFIVNPSSLPMVCRPNPWSFDSYGGFLLNKREENGLVIGSNDHFHKLSMNNYLFDAINQINSIKFSINTDLLNFIKNEDNSLIYKNLNSMQKLQVDITIRVAEIFSTVPFYLNVNCDWRGRVYTNSFFLSYQGGDLSKSLIQFEDGELLNERGIKYLYVCGANFYGNKVNKLSINNRVEWVNKHKSRIECLDKDLINEASDKLQFISFCLVLKNLAENNNYKVKLPIFLDATCSGLQHLAGMLHDSQIGALVNLTTKTDNDIASDIYNELVNPINKKINDYGKEKVNFHPLLAKVKLNRDILKQCIMTQVYNVSVDGIYKQLISKLEKTKITKKLKDGTTSKGLTKYIVPSKNGKFVTLEYTDVYAMAVLIKNISLDVYPSLRHIYNYFKSVTRLLVNLGLPVVWITPNGTEITESYQKFETKKISLSYFGRQRKSVFNDPTGLINNSKQSQAIIPNIIHYLDASHLINVINVSKTNNILSVITVHDCFGTHPNYMEKLSSIVRYEFIKLYTQEDFLQKYHSRVIQSIRDNGLEIIERKNGTLCVLKAKKNKEGMVEDKRFDIPVLPDKGDLNMDEIKNAKLMIN